MSYRDIIRTMWRVVALIVIMFSNFSRSQYTSQNEIIITMEQAPWSFDSQCVIDDLLHDTFPAYSFESPRFSLTSRNSYEYNTVAEWTSRMQHLPHLTHEGQHPHELMYHIVLRWIGIIITIYLVLLFVVICILFPLAHYINDKCCYRC